MFYFQRLLVSWQLLVLIALGCGQPRSLRVTIGKPTSFFNSRRLVRQFGVVWRDCSDPKAILLSSITAVQPLLATATPSAKKDFILGVQNGNNGSSGTLNMSRWPTAYRQYLYWRLWRRNDRPIRWTSLRRVWCISAMRITSNGTYQLSGTGQLVASSETIGYPGGTGQFIQTGGTNSNSGLLTITNGSYSMNGNSELTANGLQVNSGTFNQTDSICNFGNATLYIAYNTTSVGSYTLGGNSQLYAGNESVGSGSNRANFTQTGGINDLDTGTLNVGGLGTGGSAGTAMYTLSGGTLLSGNQTIGGSGSGGIAAFVQSGGTNNLGNYNLYVGEYNTTSSYSIQTGAMHLWRPTNTSTAKFLQFSPKVAVLTLSVVLTVAFSASAPIRANYERNWRLFSQRWLAHKHGGKYWL